MNIHFKIVMATAVLLVAESSFAAELQLNNICNPWLDTFYKLPLKERISTFKSYDLENQYIIFICGNQVVHPPAIYLAEPFAKQGSAIVPFLKVKLAQANDDLTIRDIVLVFAEMGRQHSYNVSKDVDLVKVITGKVGGMHDPDWKAAAQGNVNKILEASK